MYKDDVEKFKERIDVLVETYNFRGLIHVTDFCNFINIMKSGCLKSREEIKRDNIIFTDGANKEVLSHANVDVKKSVRFYFRAKTPTFHNNEGIKINNLEPHMPIPVCLIYSEELIYLKDTYFCDGNATNWNTKFGKDYNFFHNIDWASVFHSTWFHDEEKAEIIRKRQAELLSKNSVPIEYLKKVIFRSNADMKRAVHLLGNNSLFAVKSEMFFKKNNYLKDYSLKIEDKKLIFKYAFYNNCTYKKYKNHCIIKDDDNQIIHEWDITFAKDNHEKITLEFPEYNDEWAKFEYYINGHLSCEKYLRSYRNYILDYSLKVDNYLYFKLEFRDEEFNKYKHYCRLIDKNGAQVNKWSLKFIHKKSRIRHFKFSDNNKNGVIFEYYIEDKLCFQKHL